MANKPHARPAVPTGDFGLGLCLPCLGGVIAGEPGQPRFAVSLVPMPWPAAQPAAIVAVPACFEHIEIAATAAAAPSLLVANGRMP
jgi:hypothetical protein